MTKRTVLLSLSLACGLGWLTLSVNGADGRWRIVGWNDLGMHCMDGKDYSIYSILPPYNNIHAQVVNPAGKLVTTGSEVKLTFEAVADATGSINKTSAGKTNFWQYVRPLFGLSIATDVGLTGVRMPGRTNKPQPMKYEAAHRWFSAEGIPISPYDDAGKKNYYPMLRIKAVSAATGALLASTDIVVPVSDEMDCSSCHRSGSPNTARPASGWSYLSDPERDYKMNVLKLHDEKNAGAAYTALLLKAGYNPAGLVASVNVNRTPVLCAKCHLSNALGVGTVGVSPLTTAIHRRHANVLDPVNNMLLDASENRSSCYRCHPGSETKCLRGAMGNATESDGAALMQCQSCHGNMTAVGNPARTGWLDQPNCQSCHTGTAVRNNGRIRYTTSLEASGAMRVAVDNTFATNPNTPAAGLSLYRFSAGHGGLQCEACHGATHAEYPSSHSNDNVQNIRLQGYAGTLAECGVCHAAIPETVTGGPHGLHPLGAFWIDKHKDPGKKNPASCQACHGLDYRGTVLSATLTSRSFRHDGRTITLPKGTQVGCYNCHNGPRGE